MKLWAIMLFGAALAASAQDTVTFFTGQSVTGRVVSYEDGVIKYQGADGKPRQLFLNEIKSIRFDAPPSAAAEAPLPTPTEASAASEPAATALGPPVGSYTVSELMAAIIDLGDKLVKLEFTRRQQIQQLENKNYRSQVFDGKSWMTIELPPEAFKWFSNVPDLTAYIPGSAKKSFYVFGSVQTFSNIPPAMYPSAMSSRYVFNPVGRTMRKKNNDTVEYSW